MSDKPQRIDFGFYAILMLVAAVVVWLLLTPFVPSVALATMRRFHLSTDSFPPWAAQFPIPAMYNFANQFEIRDVPPDLVSTILEPKRSGYLNHFSARVVTFADGRYYNLREVNDCWVTLRSDYRSQTLQTRWHLKRDDDIFELDRISSEDSAQ